MILFFSLKSQYSNFSIYECFYFFVNIKINYYWLNRQELLQKAKEKYHNKGGKRKLLNII